MRASKTNRIPDWCIVESCFDWRAPHITGKKVVRERIIGYTDNGFLHTGCDTPIYETPFNNLRDGKVFKLE